MAISRSAVIVSWRWVKLAHGPARRELDARGLIVTPGFIDMHSHSDYVLLEDGHAQSKIRQGVTTEVLGEGTSAGPFKNKIPLRRKGGDERRWTRLGEYFDLLDSKGRRRQRCVLRRSRQYLASVMGNSFARPMRRPD